MFGIKGKEQWSFAWISTITKKQNYFTTRQKKNNRLQPIIIFNLSDFFSVSWFMVLSITCPKNKTTTTTTKKRANKLGLSEQHPKTKRYSVYCHVQQRKAASSYTGKAGKQRMFCIFTETAAFTVCFSKQVEHDGKALSRYRWMLKLLSWLHMWSKIPAQPAWTSQTWTHLHKSSFHFQTPPIPPVGACIPANTIPL